MSTWAVLKDAPGCADGINLLRYWSSPQVAERWVRYTKNPTGLVGSLYDPEYGRDAFARFMRSQQERQADAIMDPLLIHQQYDASGVLEEGYQTAMQLFRNTDGSVE